MQQLVVGTTKRGVDFVRRNVFDHHQNDHSVASGAPPSGSVLARSSQLCTCHYL